MSNEPKVVEASCVLDYLDRYYKSDRRASIESFAPGHLLMSYEFDFEVFGFVHTAGYDNITGNWICWPEWKEVTQEQVELRQSYPDYIQTRNSAAASLGRCGGSTITEKKSAAARQNGKLGGRKPKFSLL